MASGKTAKRATHRGASAASDLRTSKLRLLGVGIICTYIAFVPLIFDPAADWPFTVPKALLSHALAYVLGGVMAGLLIRFGREAVVWSWLHIPVVAFLVVNAVAAIVAEDRLLALYGAHARMLGLGTIAAWTLLYFAVTTFVRTRADVVAIIVSGLGAVVVMLGYEGVQLLGRDPFRWSTDTAARPFSTNGQATSLAAYFTVLAVSILAVALATRDARRWTRVALVAFSAALLAGAAATGTRSALIGLAAGSTMLMLLIWLKHPSPRARTISLAVAAATAMGFAMLLTLTPIGNRILQASPVVGDSEEENLARLDLASLDVRAVLYQVAIDVVRERPLLGYGPDNFVVGMTRHRPERGPDEARLTYATSAHSWLGQIATGSGLIGLAAFIGIVAGVGVLTARSDFRAVTIASATGLTAFLGTGLTSVSDVGSDWVFWVGAALVAGSAADVSAIADPSERTRRAGRGEKGRQPLGAPRSGLSLAAALCVIGGIGLAITATGAMDASRLARLSQDSRLLGRTNQAIDSAVASTRSDPGRAEYWHRLGLAYVSGARWNDASRALEQATQLAPWDVRYLQDLIQTKLVLARDGDSAARARAIQLADDGVRIDPNYPPIHFTRAVVMQSVGNVPEAIRSIERAFALDPNSRDAQWFVSATQLYIAAGRPTEGVRVARQGVVLLAKPAIQLELARALLAAGQPQDALAEVDKVLAVEPSNAVAQRLRADIQLAMTR